jgi:hypothetical protein
MPSAAYTPKPLPYWLDPAQKSVTDSTLTSVVRALAGLLGAGDPTSVMGSVGPMATAANPSGPLSRVIQGLAGKKPIRAYHGSPHDFDKFELSKIGTGEGGRSFGAGINLTESEKYATAYKTPGRLETTGPGHMYEVQVNASADDLLDWHRPMSQQQHIQSKLAGIPQSGLPKDGDPFVGGTGTARWRVEGGRYFLETSDGTRFQMSVADINRLYGMDNANLTGGNIYNRASIALGGDDVAVSRLFNERGVPGVSADYHGARNYTIFDESIIDILRKYGLLPAAAAYGAAKQQQEPPK